MRIRSVALYAMALLISVLGSVGQAADDPFTGTWDLDLQASQGGARSQVLTIEVMENRESYRSEAPGLSTFRAGSCVRCTSRYLKQSTRWSFTMPTACICA